MLRLTPLQPVDTVWDCLLPAEVRILPHDLALLDQALWNTSLLTPFQSHWNQAARGQGRPTIPMATYLRLMVVKHRTGWGYETLVREVSDSLHLRRFCLLALHQRVPDESTVRKLTRRLGSPLVADLVRALISTALRERHFRPRALRCDSTVAEADIRYPTDAQLCADAVRRLAREARKLRALIPTIRRRVRDRSRAVGRRLRALGQSLGRRLGESKQAVRRFTEQCAEQARRCLGEAGRLLAEAKRRRARARGRSRCARQQAIARLAATRKLTQRILAQIRQRFAEAKISDRLVSLADPEARPVRRGKRACPTEFGYVVQLTELTPHTRRGARGLILPPKLRAGSTPENTLLPETVSELRDLGVTPREAAFDRGFLYEETSQILAPLGTRIFIPEVSDVPSPRTRRRLKCYRVGSEGRIAHLKRQYAVGRSRLRGAEGARIWETWSVLAYNLDTLATL
jgi:transposase, IS5 family